MAAQVFFPAGGIGAAEFAREVELVGKGGAPIVTIVMLNRVAGAALIVELADVGVRGGGAGDESIGIDVEGEVAAARGGATAEFVVDRVLPVDPEFEKQRRGEFLLEDDGLGGAAELTRAGIADDVHVERKNLRVEHGETAARVKRLVDAGQRAGAAHGDRLVPTPRRDRATLDHDG